MKCGEDTLNKANKELVDMSPASMDNMLEKQPRTEALKKQRNKKRIGCQRCTTNCTRSVELNELTFGVTKLSNKGLLLYRVI